MAITMGATFVARGYSAEVPHLAWLIGEALGHRGYALVDVLQPCVTFNRSSSYNFYNRRVYKLENAQHDVSDRAAAWLLAFEWDERIPIGIFYRTEDVPTYEEQVPALTTATPLDRPKHKLQPAQVEELLEEVI
jgi:2-oxoglutarate ferredoxin oxidoreductase subunit beta